MGVLWYLVLGGMILCVQWGGQRLLSDKGTRPHVRTAQFLFLLFLGQKESKLGRSVASTAALSERWVSSLVVWVGSYLARLVVTCPGFVILVGISALMV